MPRNFNFRPKFSYKRSRASAKCSRVLWGGNFATKQIYVSRYEAWVFSDYHEARWKQSGSPKDSLDLQEAQRWMRRSEDLLFEIAKNNQALFEDLGTVRALFPDSTQLRELVERIYNFKALKAPQPPRNVSDEQLARWKDETIRSLQAVVDSKYGKPIDDLLNYLSQQLPKD